MRTLTRLAGLAVWSRCFALGKPQDGLSPPLLCSPPPTFCVATASQPRCAGGLGFEARLRSFRAASVKSWPAAAHPAQELLVGVRRDPASQHRGGAPLATSEHADKRR